MNSSASPLPVTVIGGYLGAGKTTLINHLLRNADGKRLAIMVNEFGELPIDADLIEAQDDDLISLSGGCVCCTYGNDLSMALLDLKELEPRPDHVVLEASGVALPGAIASSVSLISGYSMDGVVVLADGETVRQRAVDPYMGDTVLRQFEGANIVLLNKTDLLDEAEQDALRDWLQERAPNAAIVSSSHGKVPPALVLQSNVMPDDRPRAGAHIHLDDRFQSRSLAMDKPCDAEDLAQKLAQDHVGIVRAKGFVKDFNGTLKLIQVVGQRFEVTEASEDKSLGLVLIGTDLPTTMEELNGIVSST
ncbi:MAG: GTP-binding protein [Pseudomonadota bacterium]